jgi:nitrilase
LAGPLEAEEGILYADIDLDQIIAAKRMFDAVGHYSRPDIFGFTVKNLKQ